MSLGINTCSSSSHNFSSSDYYVIQCMLLSSCCYLINLCSSFLTYRPHYWPLNCFCRLTLAISTTVAFLLQTSLSFKACCYIRLSIDLSSYRFLFLFLELLTSSLTPWPVFAPRSSSNLIYLVISLFNSLSMHIFFVCQCSHQLINLCSSFLTYLPFKLTSDLSLLLDSYKVNYCDISSSKLSYYNACCCLRLSMIPSSYRFMFFFLDLLTPLLTSWSLFTPWLLQYQLL